MAVLVPDKKLDCFAVLREKFGSDKMLFIRDQYRPLAVMAPHNIRCQQNMYGLMASPNRSVGLSHFPLPGYCDKYLKNDDFPTYVVQAVPRRKSQC